MQLCNKKKLLWIDCEMTGLDYKKDHILEIAGIITDFEGNELDRFHEYINNTKFVIDNMNEWCKENHKKSNLIELSLNSKNNYSMVEKKIISILQGFFKLENNTIYMAGNSVYNDYIFIKNYMPKISEYLHYRLFDISSIKVFINECRKDIPKFEKKKTHIAIEDIKESILEYKYYKNFLLFKN